MTTQYTPTLKLALPVTGELSGTWGDVVNDNITSMIEQAIAGLSTINTWTANAHTLTTANGTTSESRCAMLVAATGAGGTAITGAGEIICPAAAKLYVLQNTTAFIVTLKTSAGTGVAVAAGNTAFLFCDGTNVNSCVTTIVDGRVTGNLTVDGNATINGNTTLGNATSDTITATARFASILAPSVDNTYDLGSSGNSWKDLYIDGTAFIGTIDLTNLEVTNIKAKDGTASATIADSTGVMTIGSSVLTTTDINGGTIDGTAIGGSTAAAGAFTTLSSTGNTTIGDASADTVTVNGTTTFNASPIISVTDNTNAALRITQLGTGNALLVEDSTNPDASPFVITDAGRIVSGATSLYPSPINISFTDKFQLNGANNYDSSADFISWATGTDTGASLNLVRSDSGTIGTHTVVGSTDTLGNVRFFGSDGTNFIEGARISAGVDGTPGTNDMPGRLVFSTTADGASSPTEAMRISSTQSVGIGSTNTTGRKVVVSGTVTGAVTAYGIYGAVTFQSDVTTHAYGIRSQSGTQAASFTLPLLSHYAASQGTFGATSAVTTQYGFNADSSLTGATNNYGFYGDIASGSNRWNLYMSGTANNYLAGRLGIGSTGLTDALVPCAINPTGATTMYGFRQFGTVQSDVTNGFIAYQSAPSTQAAAFTLTNLRHFLAGQGTLGATSAITNQFGFQADSSLTGATNNYGFYGNIASGTGRYNFYAAGTADNYFAGQVQLGAGTVSAPALSTTGDTNTGIFFPAADTIAFSEGGVEAMRIDSDGDVGIGTSSPAYKLDMTVTAANNAGMRLYNSTSGTGNGCGISFSVANGFSSTNQHAAIQALSESSGNTSTSLAFYTSGGSNTGNATERMRINSSGNVGIGVTPSAWSGSVVLQMTGPSLWGSSGLTHLSTNTYYDGTNYKYIATDFVTDYYQLSGTHVWRYAASGTAGNTISFTQAMTLNASGNLLVGATTARSRLTVGTASSSSSAPTLGTASGAALFSNNASTSEYGLMMGSASTGQGWIQQQRVDGTATAYDLWVQPSGGNVGIGNASPGAKLDVNGSARATGVTVTGSALIAGASQTTLDYLSGSTASRLLAWGANTTTVGKLTFGCISSDASAGSTAYMTLDSSGRLLVGTTNTTGIAGNGVKITSNAVGSTSSAALTLEGTGGDFYALKCANIDMSLGSISSGGSPYWIFGGATNSLLLLYVDGTVRMPTVYGKTVSTPRNVFIDSGGVLGGISSVRASKNNIAPITDSAWLYQVSPVTFNYRKQDENGNYLDEVESETQYGLIAEDVEAVRPEFCIYVEKDGQQVLQGVHYDRMISPLIKALQEQQAIIQTLTDRLTALETK